MAWQQPPASKTSTNFLCFGCKAPTTTIAKRTLQLNISGYR